MMIKSWTSNTKHVNNPMKNIWKRQWGVQRPRGLHQPQLQKLQLSTELCDACDQKVRCKWQCGSLLNKVSNIYCIHGKTARRTLGTGLWHAPCRSTHGKTLWFSCLKFFQSHAVHRPCFPRSFCCCRAFLGVDAALFLFQICPTNSRSAAAFFKRCAENALDSVWSSASSTYSCWQPVFLSGQCRAVPQSGW